MDDFSEEINWEIEVIKGLPRDMADYLSALCKKFQIDTANKTVVDIMIQIRKTF